MTSDTGTFLALDLGAESGRAVLGRFSGDRLETEELHRFPNEPVYYNAGLHWDVMRLWLEIQESIARVTRRGIEHLDGIGVDTWGLDFALLGERGSLLDNPYHYRDSRADGMIAEVCAQVPAHAIYEETGIQFMQINSLYHLYAAARKTPELLKSAKTLLTIPDLFNYWMTGRAVCEYTNATTTQFYSLKSGTWAHALLDQLGIPTHFLGEIAQPGSRVGHLLPEIASRAGIEPCPVLAPACHDTGSAVAAISMSSASAFISSGTWSLLGTELSAPILTSQALEMNFTNEGGVCNTVRLLKNITGMWLLAGCRKDWEALGAAVSHSELISEASRAPRLQTLVDPDHPLFLHPASMLEALREFCRRTDQNAPETVGSFARCVLESLALKYRYVLDALERITGTKFEEIRVVGGGARNRLLNQFTADATNRRVVSGPVEATAVGNLGVQMLASGHVNSLSEVRRIIDRSFPTETFEPVDPAPWQDAYLRFRQYCSLVGGS